MNAGMLAVARATPPIPGGASLEWVKGSALELPVVAREFTIVVCQLGLQFLEDRLGALREMHRVAAVSADVGAALAPFVQDDEFSFPQEVHVVLASTPGGRRGDSVS